MDPYLGEIRMFAGNYAPQDWALCNGAVLNVSDNQPLYSLIGTTYGGVAGTTFALPDLRSRLPIGQGNGTGLTPRIIGQQVGAEAETLALNELPAHNHSFSVGTQDANSVVLSSANNLAHPTDGTVCYVPNPAPTGTTLTPEVLNSASITFVGGGTAHPNVMPSYPVNYIIALVGLYPTRP